MDNQKLKEYSKTALIIVVVVAVGLFAMNEFLDYTKKIQLLQTPCQLCLELNPRLTHCFEQPSAGQMDIQTINFTSP